MANLFYLFLFEIILIDLSFTFSKLFLFCCSRLLDLDEKLCILPKDETYFLTSSCTALFINECAPPSSSSPSPSFSASSLPSTYSVSLCLCVWCTKMNFM
ncbi:uncharacterized protein DS421_18g623030 [Arachis hypogaea]|nr:uncharacterized protein DS421_18g623030 [Arachis hypogaea]